MKKKNPLLLAVGALVLVLVALIAWRIVGKVDTAAGAPTPALTVSTVLPQQTTLPRSLDANGNVAAWQEASLGSESAGLRLEQVRVNVGDVVRKGAVLAVFDAAPVQADVAQAGAAVQEAQATEAEATANAARARTLQNTGALSAAQISQYETAAATAKARIAAARATLAAQQLRLRYTTVVAPDDGVISARGATVGAVPPPGTELFRMIRQGRLEWRAEVTAPDLARIHPGERAVVRTADGATVDGRVRVVAPTVDPQQRTALVYVDLPPDAAMRGPLKAGMFASGTFTLGSSPALTVPAAAVVMRDGFAYVFRVNADHHVSQLKVQLGRRVGERIEIASGLAAATPVVAAGAGFLNDGDLVAVAPAARRGS